MLIDPTTIVETAFVARMERMTPEEIECVRKGCPVMYWKWAVGHCEAAERLKKMAETPRSQSHGR